METLNITESCFFLDGGDDFLDFTLNEEEDTISKGASQTSSSFETAAAATTAAFSRGGSLGGSFPEFVEEELEWLSNKDAFPSVETCFGILADNPELILHQHHNSPVSVLENSISSTNSNSNGGSLASCCNSLKVPINYPVRARSKRRRRRRSGFGHFPMLSHVNFKNKHELPFSLPLSPIVPNSGASLGRRCLHCQADKTPQWRAGPMGPKTLCNACGVRYKSGRLLPEYRPANSPTFSNVLHSNSHRKVVEMRKQKLGGDVGGGGNGVNVACGYRVG